MNAQDKERRLRDMLRGFGGVAVAFSGGVDSTYLLKIASEELGDRVLAVTVYSAAIPQRELKQAKAFTARIGVSGVVVSADIGDIPHFTENPPDRCYHCKKAVFSEIGKRAREFGVSVVVDGTNVDDSGDHRPGLDALRELGVRSPLKECGFTKKEIRARSRALNLETWDLPSYACLASRFPYGAVITVNLLQQVERAENALYDLGFRLVRVRHHGDVARLEVSPDELPRLFDDDLRRRVVEALKNAGYLYAALDLEGYRMGSLNAVLDAKSGASS